uniref:Cytochrome b-c1 complex subunit 7 n=1 Tax=Florenciella parvula TaxID=236787 RepID=A0A7S2FYD9_9STRA|mmetsp:Transcript_26812/g.55149  ORF Transcript_26812/g.55149 Transcript_26812/m.55149 type:complete len:113 (+) Transcript_26812:68-406(+)|eukprot:CAMPEP_0119543448 /NCGR_PEP_ID=MMETSP1344-20130328/54119_1 /TAXON_ID=236787 /ORGANISM="Florenciella parvula, Strain CCMP2471" /LENGTH=112 /DNA_ID=CAMNT_0007587731 /DNA_START=47 /DNA_END=385 /DNA_ORIENTATION=+
MAASLVGKNVWNSVAKVYQAGVVQRLNQYGLKYDDILNESDPDVKIALSRMPGDLQVARDRRLKRALDISFKKKPLPADFQKTLTPLEPYMESIVDEMRSLRLERELLNGPR